MIEIDGSRFSGSGTLVRQAVAFAALTGQPIHVINARMRRTKPGLRPQHAKAIEAIRDLVDGKTEGVAKDSREFTFVPGAVQRMDEYVWDIGSAGSMTLIALAVLPVLAFAEGAVRVELHGGSFQDFAPSFFHLDQAALPLFARMGIKAQAELRRPGYVPRGNGILSLSVQPVQGCPRPVVGDQPAPVRNVTGIALASHLEERKVAQRMAETARDILSAEGYRARIEIRNDTTALQPGAALALFANLDGGWTLGADQAGAIGRPAEAIGKRVARQLLEEIRSGAIVDRFIADQVIPLAALADGESRFRVGQTTEHIKSNAWLANLFLGAEVSVEGQILSVRGVGFRPGSK